MWWYRTLATWLTSEKMGFEAGKNDPCIFYNKVTGLRLVVVVDDILVRGTAEVTEKFHRDLNDRSGITDPTYLAEDSPATCGISHLIDTQEW